MLDRIYMKLGQVEIDDMAKESNALEPSVFRQVAGRHDGTSSGGYSAVMSLLRTPTCSRRRRIFAGDGLIPLRQVYTERYMWLPDENKAG